MSKNDCGVYLDYYTHTVAAVGRSHAKVMVARCDDGRFRFAIDFQYSYGGFSGPVTDHGEGHATPEQAKEAAIERLLARWPEAWASEPESVHRELRLLREEVEALQQQPLLL